MVFETMLQIAEQPITPDDLRRCCHAKVGVASGGPCFAALNAGAQRAE